MEEISRRGSLISIATGLGETSQACTPPAVMRPEFKQALKAYCELLKRIEDAGLPPHSDYWHQSLDDAEQKIYDAARK